MSWHPVSEKPDKPGRYAVWFAGPTWAPAFWPPERGWTDGLKVLHGVRAWHGVKPVPNVEHKNG